MNLQIEYVDINSISPYERNARAHGKDDVKAIKKSIEEFGFNDPIGVWNNQIVEGHGRLLAAKELGMEQVPIIRLDELTDEQRKAYALAHNKTAELSDWDFDMLAAELQDLNDIDMSAFGFDIDKFVEEQSEIIEDEAPEPPKEPKSKVGEVWALGAHRVMCGDATKPENIEKLLGGGTGRPVFD